VIRLRQRLRRLEARRAAAPVGAGSAAHVVRYLPTDPETLTEIARILLQALAGPEDGEADVEASARAVVAYLTAVCDTLGEEGLRRYRDLANRGVRLGAEEAAELARLELLVHTVDFAAADAATDDPVGFEVDGYHRAGALP
jgi:hypothetical protein